MGDRGRRYQDPHLAGLPEGSAAGQQRALLAVRLRQLRNLGGSRFLQTAALAARPRLQLCDRARTRGRRDGQAMVRGGKLLRKTNTFTDFVACAEHLVSQGWTAPSRLVARGGSAGGLLMGAVANLAPQAF